MSENQLQLKDFEPLVNQGFLLETPGIPEPIEIRLLEVKRSTLETAPELPEPFTLLFLAPPKPELPQRIYEIKHPILGCHPMFLVPIAKSDAGVELQAVFG